MKVLLVAEWLDHVGGCETFLTALCHGLVSHGIDASVFVAAPPIDPRWRVALGDRLAVAADGADRLEALLDHVARLGPDLVHAVPLERTAFRFATIADRPTLVGTEPSDASERCHWPVYGVERDIVLPRFAAIHCFSSRAAVNLERCSGYRGPSAVVPPLCDFPTAARMWHRAAPSRRLVGWGRLSTEKGWTFVIESLAVLRRTLGPLELDLWGSGPLAPVLEQIITSCGERGRVRLMGRYADPFTLELDHYDAALVPSFFEGLPYSLLEALWRGIPAVATRISGAPDLLADGPLCRFVEPNDQAALAATLGVFYQDYDDLASHGPDRRAVVAHACSPAAAVPAMIALYRRALAVPGGAAW